MLPKYDIRSGQDLGKRRADEGVYGPQTGGEHNEKRSPVHCGGIVAYNLLCFRGYGFGINNVLAVRLVGILP